MKSKPIRLKFSSKKLESPEKSITNIEINYSPISIHDSQSKIKVKHKGRSEEQNLECCFEPADDANNLQSSTVPSSNTIEKCNNTTKESDGFFQFLCASCESKFKKKLANQKNAEEEIKEQILSLTESKKNICKIDEPHEIARRSSEGKTDVLKLCVSGEDKKQEDQLLHSSSTTVEDDLTKNPNSTPPEQSPSVKLRTCMKDKETQVGIGFIKEFPSELMPQNVTTDAPSRGFSPNSRIYKPVSWKRINTIPRRRPWR